MFRQATTITMATTTITIASLTLTIASTATLTVITAPIAMLTLLHIIPIPNIPSTAIGSVSGSYNVCLLYIDTAVV